MRRKKSKKEEQDFLIRMTDHFVLPADVVEQSIQIRISGNREVLVGNYKKLLQFTAEQVVICGKKQKICIQGRNLQIPVFAEDGLRITGGIQSICFDSLY